MHMQTCSLNFFLFSFSGILLTLLSMECELINKYIIVQVNTRELYNSLKIFELNVFILVLLFQSDFKMSRSLFLHYICVLMFQNVYVWFWLI